MLVLFLSRNLRISIKGFNILHLLHWSCSKDWLSFDLELDFKCLNVLYEKRLVSETYRPSMHFKMKIIKSKV